MLDWRSNLATSGMRMRARSCHRGPHVPSLVLARFIGASWLGGRVGHVSIVTKDAIEMFPTGGARS